MGPVRQRPESWIDEAPHRLSASQEISASPSTVWEVLADHESWPEWFPAVHGITVTGAAAGVGAQRRVRLPGMVVDEEFVAWDVGERYAFTAVAMSPPAFESLTERITIDDLGEGRSRVTYTQAFAPAWWFRLPFLLMKGRLQRNLARGLEGLASRVSGG